MMKAALPGAMMTALRIVYPSQCLCCGETVDADDALCPVCWRDADFVAGSACARCGVPLPGDGEGKGGAPDAAPLSCDDCLSIVRPWAAARAALTYAGTGRMLALALKHGDRPDLAPALGRWLARAAAPLVAPGAPGHGALVVPVPVHFRRLLKRKYNQAALMSAQVARVHGLTHAPRLLARVRATPAQDHRSVADRFANVAGAMAVPARHASALDGRPVLLVDDVMTSGATLAAAADALLAAGSGPVSVAVLCRAVKDR